ncbi:hypothetical protein RvY_10132 [Ramazzottius varieornatus]|uniref:Kazal-like domain-containing protein n=1 Tax=Ramazzottius varieornatus TaxID=947166 RepID=A0A1D1VH48_RAMVA|nr:hypothetical protein RvY_10132 [Ramazzottius varieornatus]
MKYVVAVTLVMTVLVALFIQLEAAPAASGKAVRDWMKGGTNVPFDESVKASIKSCFKKNCKSKRVTGPRVCGADGKRFKNSCKLTCARMSGYTSKQVACPPETAATLADADE